MRVSFDLDDTLILKSVAGEVEPALPSLKRSYIDEYLRKGAYELITSLANRGCEIWIYTNSFRGRTELSYWFKQCGLPIAGIINQQMHDVKREELGLRSLRPSKYPPWFDIDLHFDDSLELEEDAKQNGFRVVRIAPEDPEWATRISRAVEQAFGKAEI